MVAGNIELATHGAISGLVKNGRKIIRMLAPRRRFLKPEFFRFQKPAALPIETKSFRFDRGAVVVGKPESFRSPDTGRATTAIAEAVRNVPATEIFSFAEPGRKQT